MQTEQFIDQKLHQSESGYTLLEVLVSFVLLATVLAYSSQSFVTHLSANHWGEIRSEGAQAAQTVLDELRSASVVDLPTSGSDAPIDVEINDKRTFEVVVAYCTAAQYCSSNEARHLELEVWYRGEVIYTTETVFTGLTENSGSGSSSSSSGGGPATCFLC